MGFESTHRQVHEELALDLARTHRIELARAIELLREAEQLAIDDPSNRSIRHCFAIVLERDEASRVGKDGGAPGTSASGTPGRQTLVMQGAEGQDGGLEQNARDDAGDGVRAAEPRSLDATTRSRMEQAFGVDFNGVAIVPNSTLATGSTRAIAKDSAIHFRRGAYRPGTAAGDRLIAHELAHIVQQRGGIGTRSAPRREIEREADRAATLVTAGRTAPIALRAQPGTAYAYSDDEDHDHGDHAEHEHEAAEGTPKVSRHWIDALAGSSGRPLPGALRKRLEVALKADLSGVRIHDGSVSDEAAREIHANAFTLGKDIHFARGKFDPGSPQGQELIAHEVAHAVQGGHVSDFSNATISTPGDSREVEAHQFAAEFARKQAEEADADAPRPPQGQVSTGRGASPGPRGGGRSVGVIGPVAPAASSAPASPQVALGSVSKAVVHRDGADGPKPPPAAKPKKAAKPPEAKSPDINEGELAKNKKDANDPEQDKKDKEKFEKDNPQAKKDPEPIKPAVKDPGPVATPKPTAKKGGDEVPAKKGGAPDKVDLKTPPKGGASPKPAIAAPKKGKAESAVCAAADNDVGKFWATAPRDPKANEISDRTKEMWAAAQGLAPAGEGDDMIAALNPVTAVYNDGFGKSDLGQAVAGLDQSKSPYAEFNEKYRGIAMVMAGIRDVAFNLSNVLGKIGLVLTVVGFILSLFGVGAILVTIGRVISVINLVLDVVAAVAGIIVAGITAAQIKEETDPYKRAKLAKLLISDVNKAASNVVNAVMGGTKVGKVVGKVVGGIAAKLGKLLAFVARPITAAISRVYQAMSKFFAKLAASNGRMAGVGKVFVAAEKGVVGLGKKAMSNRAKVMAQVDAKDAHAASEEAKAKQTAANERNTAKQGDKTKAQTNLDEAKAKTLEANKAAKEKLEASTGANKELETRKGEATTKKGELEGAKTSEKEAKSASQKADKDLKQAEAVRKKADTAAKANEKATNAANETAKNADTAAKAAERQHAEAVKTETAAKTAVDQATAAEAKAVEAAQKARDAAAKAKAAAGGDADAAAKAAADAEKAATDARLAADNLSAAQKEAQQAKAAAETAAKSEKALTDAKTKAATEAETAAKAQEQANKTAADAQKAAAEAESAASKAVADKAAAEKIKQQADLAKTERDRATAAKNAAEEAAARKTQADAANAKAKAEVQKVADQKAAADTAAAAEAKALEQQKLAETQKAKAAETQKAADDAAAKSKADADKAARDQMEADAQVQKDRADLAKKEADLKAAEADRQAKAAQEKTDKAASDLAEEKRKSAQAAKDIADEKLKTDTGIAEQKKTAAETKKTTWNEKQTALENAKTAKQTADTNAANAQKAAKEADQAAKETKQAADKAKTGEDSAQTKLTDAEARAKEADKAKTLADKEALEAETAAKDAEQHLKDAEAHKAATKKDPETSGPVPQPKKRVDETMTGDGMKESGGAYAAGQWQQELATKNDPQDQWGTPGFLGKDFGGTGRLDLDPAKSRIRAPRMTELRATTPRSVSVSDAVSKIFAKKTDDAAAQPQPSGPVPGATPAPSAEPAAKPDAKPDPASATAEVGPIPYWPDLLKNYSFDLGAMSEARGQVQAYKAAQQAAVQMAQGDLKKRAAEIRAEAAAKKAPVKQNQDGLNKDKTNLDESKGGNQKQIDQENKSDQEKAKADGPGKDGADAAEQAAAAEPPPAKGWWGKIKAAANWLLKNTLGRAMKFVTDAITNVVLFGIKHLMGVDVKEMATYGMQTADEGKAKAAEGTTDTTQAGTKNDKVETDIAAEDMTLGQRIAAGQKNVTEAEAFEKAIDAQEKALQAEIAACNDFVAQVTAQFAKCKAEADKAAAAQPGPDKAAPKPAPVNDAATPTPTDGGKPDAAADPHAAALLKEAQTLCSNAVDTEIAELQALNAKGAGILMAQAGSDPAEVAQAQKLAHDIESGALKTALDKLNALKSKADGGTEEGVVAAAGDIDHACHDGAEAVANAYVAAEAELLAAPPSAPTP